MYRKAVLNTEQSYLNTDSRKKLTYSTFWETNLRCCSKTFPTFYPGYRRFQWGNTSINVFNTNIYR